MSSIYLRKTWGFVLIIVLGMLIVSHYFFQNYLYMQPCEQCVYIRYATWSIAIGAILAVLCPVKGILFFSFVFSIYGITLGIHHSLLLNHIAISVQEANPFIQMNGCKNIPIFPFNIPLHIWFPEWFMPSGECGLDIPRPPQNSFTTLDSLQQFFIGSLEDNFSAGLYSHGWWLIPQKQFMNMALCCLICFIVIGLLILYALWLFEKNINKMHEKINWFFIIMSTTVLLLFLGQFS